MGAPRASGGGANRGEDSGATRIENRAASEPGPLPGAAADHSVDIDRAAPAAVSRAAVQAEPAPSESLPLEQLPILPLDGDEGLPANLTLPEADPLPLAGVVAAPEAPEQRARDHSAGGRDAMEVTEAVRHSSEPRRAPAATEVVRADVRAEVDRAARVLEQIRIRVADGVRFASFQLEPRDLGRLSVRIAMQAGRLAAIVRAESEQTLDLLERHLPELRASLAAQGIEAESLELALGFEEPASEQFNGRRGPRSRSGRSFAVDGGAESPGSADGPTLPLSNPLSPEQDGVDTYA